MRSIHAWARRKLAWLVDRFRIVVPVGACAADATDSLGAAGERLAERFLRRKRYRIVARRARSQLGELDLVAVDGRVVVFIEVKTRRSQDGNPADAVDHAKQQRLTRAALGYLKRQGLLEYSARFDVVAVTWPADGASPIVEHVTNAFEPIGKGQMFS